MSNKYFVTAETRKDKGKGASRRLRHSEKVPGILYGAGQNPVSITVPHNELMLNLQHEAFYSQILNLKLDGKDEAVVLRDLQRHPAKPRLLHADFQRVDMNAIMHVNLPLHFINEDKCEGVKLGGGLISRLVTEVQISCLPKDLPEYIPVDIATLQVGQTIHLSELVLPPGVSLVALSHGGEHDTGVVTVYIPRAMEEEPVAVVAEGEAAEAAAVAETDAKGKAKEPGKDKDDSAKK